MKLPTRLAAVLIATILIVSNKDSKEIQKISLKQSNSEDSSDLEEIVMALDSENKEVVEYYSDMLSLTQNKMILAFKRENEDFVFFWDNW